MHAHARRTLSTPLSRNRNNLVLGALIILIVGGIVGWVARAPFKPKLGVPAELVSYGSGHKAGTKDLTVRNEHGTPGVLNMKGGRVKYSSKIAPNMMMLVRDKVRENGRSRTVVVALINPTRVLPAERGAIAVNR